MERRRAKKIKPSTSVTATNTTAECCDSPNSSSSGCSSQKSGPIVLPEKIKNELDELVKKQHNYVYPALPKAGAIMIPIGGLARCRCKKDCKFELNEPAYAYIERFNEPRLAIWEKTRQKRIKKN